MSKRRGGIEEMLDAIEAAGGRVGMTAGEAARAMSTTHRNVRVLEYRGRKRIMAGLDAG